MALKFYLGEKNNSHIINVETNASFIENMATFDTGSFTMEWNLTDKAVAPFTKFFIEDTELNDTWCFVIVSDEVEVVRKMKPVKYLHHLVLKQNTYKMTNHIVRNSVFSQPISKDNKTRFVISGSVSLNSAGGSIVWGDGVFEYNKKYSTPEGTTDPTTYPNGYQEQMEIIRKEKIAYAYLEIETYQKLFTKKANDIGRWHCFNYDNPVDTFINNHKNIYLVIEKYIDGVLDDTLPIQVGENQTYVRVDSNFFETENDAIYKMNVYENADSIFNEIPLSSYQFETPNVSGKYLFTNVKATLHVRTYYYSLYDVLDILSQQVLKKYNWDINERVYELPESGEIYDTLKETIAPNFNFTGKDLYSCVYEVLSYIDAIPTLDEDNILGFVYLNQNQQSKVSLQMTDKKISLNEENFANTLLANYQNGRQEHPITYPAKNIFARVGSSAFGVPDSKDYSFNVSKPIDYIDKASVLLGENFNVNLYIFSFTDDTRASCYRGLTIPEGVLDITSSIFEKTLYSLLPMADGDSYTSNQLNSVYFTQGDTKIIVGDIVNGIGSLQQNAYTLMIKKEMANMFGIIYTYYWLSRTTYEEKIGNVMDVRSSLPSKRDLKFNLEYHAIFDGRVSQESTKNKVDGEVYINQSNANVSLNRMGNNMQGLIAKLGNERKNFTLPITSYGSRLKVGSMWVDDDGNKYVANAIKTTFSTSSQKVFVEAEFTKDFNMLSQFTQIDQERRFYEISERLTSKGYENITEFIYFTTQEDVVEEEWSYVALRPDGFDKMLDILKSTPETSSSKADFVCLDTYEYADDTTKSVASVYCPLHTYGFGNSICFEMGYDDPLNAGNRLLGSATTSNPLNNQSTLYTKNTGFADKINVSVYSYSGDSMYASEQFPIMDESSILENAYPIISIRSYEYWKKPNEIFHLNYSVAFMPYKNEEIFFGDEFINNNLIINGTIKKEKLYLFVSNSEEYSIIDNKPLGTSVGEATVEITRRFQYNAQNVYRDRATISIRVNRIFRCISWCLADEDGNILIACNQNVRAAVGVNIYAFTRRKRIIDN